MIIQYVLTAGLLLCLLYALVQRRKSRLVSFLISAVAAAGIYFVQFPDTTNTIAHWMGVGRGADLVLYCWLVISLVVSLNLQFKILKLQGSLTDLAREIALQAPRGELQQGLRQGAAIQAAAQGSLPG
jgi:small membrane protein